VENHNRKPQSTGSVVAAVLHDLLRGESFTREADLRDALKQRLTRYRVAWTNDELDQALRIVEHRRPLTTPELADGAPGAELPPVEPITRADAPMTLHGLLDRWAKEHPDKPKPFINTMPQVEWISQRDADRRKAIEMTLHQVQASIARCDALEAALVEPADDGIARRR
jgi:hypothetical protein